MNAQEISIRHSALGWVKKSIDDNLSEIKIDLKRYVESKEQGLLEGVKQRLGVIQGVLVMIEQYGAAMLTEEMAALVDFIVAEKEPKDDQALEVLLRAVLQLPDYLEHIQSGHRDIPITILPLLNDVRAVRNQDLFSEKLLFLPDLSMHEDEAEIESIDDASNQASRMLAKKLRPVYQLALVNIIRDRSVEESLKRLEKICETLEERSVSEQIARIWWIVGALIESVARQQLELGVSIKNLLGKVDALFRVILIIGERGLLQRQPIELIKNFLFYVAQPECDGPKAQAIKTAYRLEQFLPSESARSEVLDNIAGPNQALLKTVAEAMKAEIETIKSTLEVYVNGDLSQVSTLKDLPQEMHIISDTLAMIGLGAQRQMIEAQIEAVKNILTAGKAVDEELLLSMAAELLQVEQALDQMPKRQPKRDEQPRTESDVSRDYELDSVLSAVVAAALDDIQKTKAAILEFIKDPAHRDNIELCITLMLESRGAMQLLEQQRAVTVVDGLLRYLRGYEISRFMESERLDALSQVVVSLEYFLEALGEHRSDASSILDLADLQLQKLLVGLSSDNEIVADEQSVVELAKSADGNNEVTETAPAHELVAEIEEAAPAPEFDDHILEDTQILAQDFAGEDMEQQPRAVASQRPDAEGIDVTQVMGQAQEEQQESNTDTVTETAQMDATLVISAGESGAEMQAIGESNGNARTGSESARDYSAADRDVTQTAASSLSQTVEIVPVDDGAEVLLSGSDEEILEIYLEEAEEEASNIVRLQRDWMLHPEDENALKNIRRAFHTIKGSGRLVGALKISEFAWDYEQLLNRIIDKTVPPERPVINAVGKAGQALTELVHELKTFEEPSSDIPYLRGLARALAEFRTGELLIDHTQHMSNIESPYDHITDAEGDEDDNVDAGLGATTQIIEQGSGVVQSQVRADTGAGEDSIAPEMPQQQPQAEPAAAPDVSKYDDTVLTEAPPIPSMDDRRRVEAEVRAKIAAVARARAAASYQRAADYSRTSEVAPDDDAESSTPAVSEERESERPATIEIESMGDDFVGEDLIGNSEVPIMEASLMQAPLTPQTSAKTADLPAIEFEEVALPGDDRDDASELAQESDK
ncbi:Hpt domain-containing protein, partial [Gammaproteobacteria bacterium]|nr:Hpt domain-containing protein [Gammaproteobacteria bacterium]